MTEAKLPISVIVLTFNEESNILSCLASVSAWAGEIFIVDSGSTDRTLELTRSYPVEIVQHPFENYSQQRNWAQANLSLKFDWVFHIDADERVTPRLEQDLRHIFAHQNNGVSGFLVRRRICFLGKAITHGGIYPTYHCRVFLKNVGRCEDREYDQHFVVSGETRQLESDLIEETASSLFTWTMRHNRWAQMEAKHLLPRSAATSELVQPHARGTAIQRRRWLRASVYERSPIFFRALLYFVLRYFIRLGFLDGTAGLIYHVLHGFWFRFYVDACYFEALHSVKK